MPYSNYEDKLEYNCAWKRANNRCKRRGVPLGTADVLMERCKLAYEELDEAQRELRRERRSALLED